MRITKLLGVGLLGLSLAACQGRPVPLAVQAGSSIVIPLENGALFQGSVGYGGTEVEDFQRGTLIYQLDGPGGFELVTRGTSAVMPPPSSTLAKDGLTFVPPLQLVSLVDIPDDAPLGTHSLHVIVRRMEDGVPVESAGPAYAGAITILPKELEVDLGGGPVTVTGEPTPFERRLCAFGNCTWLESASFVSDIVPRPELQLQLSQSVWSFEIELEYPPDVIDVVDAFQSLWIWVPANERGLVWFDDDGNGTVRISGAATGTGTFDLISLVFELDDGANAILDPEDTTATVLRATDADGNPLAATAAVAGVF